MTALPSEQKSLSDIKDATEALESTNAQVDENTDGLEGLLTTLNATLTALNNKLSTQTDGSTNSQNPLLVGAEAQDPTALPTNTTAGKIVRFFTDLSRRIIVTLGTTIAGEDITKDVLKVEQRYIRARATADSLLVTGAGRLHTITISPLTATPVAGLLTIYDNTAESGTVIYSEWVFATAQGKSVTLDIAFGTGVYVGFDASLANVACGISYTQ